MKRTIHGKGGAALNFGFRRHKMPPLLKCVVCEHRPGATMHHHLPVCKSCAATLEKHIKQDGGAIIEGLAALRHADSPGDVTGLSEKILEHASKLIQYEEKRVKTIEPEPTVIMHRVRIGEYDDLSPTLYE